MSRKDEVAAGEAWRTRASLFAALGDETRLQLVAKLSLGERCSIAGLSEGSRLTRQAITKHLRVLENVGLVQGERRGREILFEFMPKPIEDAKGYLASVSGQWDQVLGRLKSFVENEASDSL